LYNWDNSLPSNQNNTVSPNITTDYSVIVTDIYGCKDTSSTRIVVEDVPNLVVDQNQFLACIGATLQIIASGANEYNWSTNDTTSMVEIVVEGVTTYSVVGSIGNCFDVEVIDVIIKPMPTLVMDANKTSISTHDSIFFYSSGSVASNYSWDFKDGSTSILSNPYHKFGFSGAYQVELTVEMGGCKTSDSILVYVGTVSIDEKTEFNVLVYPNPAKEFINIEVAYKSELLLRSIKGEIVGQYQLSEGANKVEINNLSKGIYLGRVKSSNNTSQFKLIVN